MILLKCVSVSRSRSLAFKGLQIIGRKKSSQSKAVKTKILVNSISNNFLLAMFVLRSFVRSPERMFRFRPQSSDKLIFDGLQEKENISGQSGRIEKCLSSLL